MEKQRRPWLAVAAAVAVMAASPVAGAADETPETPENGTKEAPLDQLDEAGREALERAQELLDMLQRWWRGMPRYAAPEINENGDIIIRRLPPKPEDGQPDKQEKEDQGAVEL